MQTAKRARDASRMEPRGRGWARDALWLAGRDIRLSWASFPATFVAAFAFGILAAMQYRNALYADLGTFGHAVLDLYMISLVAVLGSNLIFNRDYFGSLGAKGFNGRLSFLRSLPVSSRSVVFGRLAPMLMALAIAVPAFFLTPYLVYGGLREFIEFGDYLWYVGIWAGYALLATGGLIYSNFALNWTAGTNWTLRGMITILIMYGLIVFAANLAFDDGLALTLMELARTNGPLAAATSVFGGVLAMVLLARKSEKGLEKRDIG